MSKHSSVSVEPILSRSTPRIPLMSRVIVLAAAAILVASAPAAAESAEETQQRLTKSIQVLTNLTSTPDEAIPAYVLERAEAIVVIPTLVKGGFVLGAEHGKGVMSVRDRATKQWSAPHFIAMTGGSIGWQIGVQSTDLVLVVTNRGGVDDLLKSEFTLGANASVAAGPVGRSAEASTDARIGAKILAYSRAKGLFAGASIDGSSLRPDEEANESFYGRAMTPDAIFALKRGASLPSPAATWQRELGRILGGS
jgi:lipid-binding SYLF domain-containing protein